MNVYETIFGIILTFIPIVIILFTNELTAIKILLPYSLLTILYLVIQNINNTHTSGILFIDYFSIRQWDVILAFILGYIMLMFLIFTIIFAYNAIYDHTKTCHPLMFYLGNKKTCIRTNFDGFENKDELFIDKIRFLWEIIKMPFIQIYLGYLAIIHFIIKTVTYIKTKSNTALMYYFTKQNETADKVKTIFVEPLMIQFTDPLFKILQRVFDSISNK